MTLFSDFGLRLLVRITQPFYLMAAVVAAEPKEGEQPKKI